MSVTVQMHLPVLRSHENRCILKCRTFQSRALTFDHCRCQNLHRVRWESRYILSNADQHSRSADVILAVQQCADYYVAVKHHQCSPEVQRWFLAKRFKLLIG